MYQLFFIASTITVLICLPLSVSPAQVFGRTIEKKEYSETGASAKKNILAFQYSKSFSSSFVNKIPMRKELPFTAGTSRALITSRTGKVTLDGGKQTVAPNHFGNKSFEGSKQFDVSAPEKYLPKKSLLPF